MSDTKVYLPPLALTGLDYDLYQAEQKDLKQLAEVQKELALVKEKRWGKLLSSPQPN